MRCVAWTRRIVLATLLSALLARPPWVVSTNSQTITIAPTLAPFATTSQPSRQPTAAEVHSPEPSSAPTTTDPKNQTPCLNVTSTFDQHTPHILLVFSEAVLQAELGRPAWEICQEVFTKGSLGTLQGASRDTPQCQWIADNKLQVYVPFESSLSVSSRLSILPQAVIGRQFGSPTCEVEITPESIDVNPSIRLVGPSDVAISTTKTALMVDTVQSSGLLGFGGTFAWTVNSTVQQVQNGSLLIIHPVLNAPESYVGVVSLTNMLGRKSEATFFVAVKKTWFPTMFLATPAFFQVLIVKLTLHSTLKHT